jgi:hypothetical protein
MIYGQRGLEYFKESEIKTKTRSDATHLHCSLFLCLVDIHAQSENTDNAGHRQKYTALSAR